MRNFSKPISFGTLSAKINRICPGMLGISLFFFFSILAGGNFLYLKYHQTIVQRASEISTQVAQIQVDSLHLMSVLHAYVAERAREEASADPNGEDKGFPDHARADKTPKLTDLHHAAHRFRMSWPKLAKQFDAEEETPRNFPFDVIKVRLPEHLRELWASGPTGRDLENILAFQSSACKDICIDIEMSTYQRNQLTTEITDLVRTEVTPRLDQMRDAANEWRSDALRSMSLASLTGVSVLVLTGLLFMITAVIPQARRFKSSQTTLRLQNETLEERVALRTDELSRALVAAETASNAKTDFLKSINHEIRTPMNGVLGTAALLRSSQLDHRDQALVDTIHMSGRSMMNFLESTIEMANLSAGDITSVEEDISVEDLVTSAVDELTPTLQTSRIKVETEFVTGRSQNVKVDRIRLKQVLSGLIKNAVQYSEADKIWVRTSVKRADQAETLQIDVEDDGVGIDAAAQAKIFSLFYRGDQTGERHGAGLGLPIARAIMEAMGGDITVDSVPGAGSTFRIHLTRPQAT